MKINPSLNGNHQEKNYFKLDSSLALFNKQTFKNQNFTNYAKKKPKEFRYE